MGSQADFAGTLAQTIPQQGPASLGVMLEHPPMQPTRPPKRLQLPPMPLKRPP